MKSCPFCKSEDCESEIGDSEYTTSCFVECKGCGARGPWRGSWEKAEESWDDREDK